jgi:hypothetical protein
VSPARRWRRFVGTSLLTLLVVGLGVGAWMLYLGVSISLRAEENLHATEFAIRLVDQFVYDKGRWPRSWQELERLRFPGTRPSPLNSSLRGWPTDWPSGLQERVSIDFQADPAVVARQAPRTVEAIRPNGPCYEYRAFVPSLQETLKKATKLNGQNERTR